MRYVQILLASQRYIDDRRHIIYIVPIYSIQYRHVARDSDCRKIIWRYTAMLWLDINIMYDLPKSQSSSAFTRIISTYRYKYTNERRGIPLIEFKTFSITSPLRWPNLIRLMTWLFFSIKLSLDEVAVNSCFFLSCAPMLQSRECM